MTILLCGASGMVGKEMCKFFDEKKIKYYGTYNNNKINKKNMFKLDFLDKSNINDFLIEKKISCCIFLIVQRLTDICENDWENVKKINIDMVDNMSLLCNNLNINFIHLSTDYVFDGKTQPNFPDSMQNPLQNYGITKLLSELKVKRNCKKYCIIRTPVLYSSYTKLHDNAVTLIGKQLMNLTKTEINENNYYIRRPLYVSDLCNFIYYSISNNLNNTYHFYNNINKYTKYQILCIISKILNIDSKKIKFTNSKNLQLANRPYDTQLTDNKFNITDFKFTNFNNSLNFCFNKFKHSKINKLNKDDFFFLIDLDGTIIESNESHYTSYKNVFKNRNKEFISFDDWNEIVNNNSIDELIIKTFGSNKLDIIKKEKYKNYMNSNITFKSNSNIFINFLIQNNVNHCIVTNSSKNSIEINKNKLPLLKKINNWVVREDYNLKKPNPECYMLAKNKYYNNEKYIIGIEDTLSGFFALKKVTDIIYINSNIKIFKNEDCWLFNNFEQLFT